MSFDQLAFPGSIKKGVLLSEGAGEVDDESARDIVWQGMTLRQYYAGQALQGFFSGIPFDVETPMTEADDKYLEEVARVCFKMADAMLKEANRDKV